MLDEGVEPANPRIIGRHLGAKVAARLPLGADLGNDEFKDIGCDLPLAHQLYRRNDDALLIHLLEGSNAGRRAAPDIDVMGQIGYIAKEFLAAIDGRNQRDVVEMDSAAIGIVDEDCVPGLQVFWTVFGDRAGREDRQRAEVYWLGKGLGDGSQLAVEKGAGEIGAGFDVGRIGAAPEGDGHLLGCFEQGVANDLELDGVDLVGHGFSWLKGVG